MTFNQFKVAVCNLFKVYLVSPNQAANMLSNYAQTETELDFVEWLQIEAFGEIYNQMKTNNQQFEAVLNECVCETGLVWLYKQTFKSNMSQEDFQYHFENVGSACKKMMKEFYAGLAK